MAGSVAPILQREGVKLILGRMEGPVAVGQYTILLQMGFFLFGLVYMISRPLWPAVADAAARGHYDWVRGMRRRLVRWFFPLAGLAVGGFAVLGPWLAGHWLHREVGLDRGEFAVYFGSFVVMVWSYLHYVFLAGCGVLRGPAVVLAVETVVVLGLAVAGSHRYGLAGAMAGSMLGQLMCSAWLLPKMLGRRLREAGHTAPVAVAEVDAAEAVGRGVERAEGAA